MTSDISTDIKSILPEAKVKSWQEESDTLREELNSGNVKDYAKASKRASDLEEKLQIAKKYQDVIDNIAETSKLLEAEVDEEMQEMIKSELKSLKKQYKKHESEIKASLVPKDPDDEKSAIIEIRAGTGGDEASLFANDLYRMYLRFSDDNGFTGEQLSISHNEQGGIKEVTVRFSGDNAYGTFKYESGTHRVQRIPSTESSGRIHTSAVTVAVLTEVEDIEVHIEEKDLKVEVMRASGPGGQKVNKTDSNVRMTHLPTGLVVTCQESKSQIQNRKTALKILKSRIYEKEKQEQMAEEEAKRRSQVGTGDRSGKIRTYNYPQDRVTDHRIKKSWNNLPEIMDGAIGKIIKELKKAEVEAKIAEIKKV
ncbi:peptide chain release factor 1 [Candidatus Woesebacteria bacterium]|nr:peptide chain release factor 1 [Candidatus Woesebacteria bacterium]